MFLQCIQVLYWVQHALCDNPICGFMTDLDLQGTMGYVPAKPTMIAHGILTYFQGWNQAKRTFEDYVPKANINGLYKYCNCTDPHDIPCDVITCPNPNTLLPSSLYYQAHQITQLICFLAHLAVVFAQSIEARC